ncbi:hypothetical protein SUGI_0003170 [Cryptomeria japonica]|nr:hypothetical protein SUGI_0003170 [Cryptomeria japonica]
MTGYIFFNTESLETEEIRLGLLISKRRIHHVFEVHQCFLTRQKCGILTIEEVIDEVGEENVVQVVTDNATSYVAVGKLLMERHPKIFWSPCAAHCLDLMLKDIGERELARPGITRFASNFLTLKSLLKSKASLRHMFVGEEWTSSSYATTTARMDVADCIFDESDFWIPCVEIVQVIEPLPIVQRGSDKIVAR